MTPFCWYLVAIIFVFAAIAFYCYCYDDDHSLLLLPVVVAVAAAAVDDDNRNEIENKKRKLFEKVANSEKNTVAPKQKFSNFFGKFISELSEKKRKQRNQEAGFSELFRISK
ncbi:hypothetical protein DERF_011986 [Dermatophagoides farinae]|uniref:Uncharacterized protein n=1 Tax=Dermatophagoides farinae TaxID=6954 RepID=A0A922HRP6_DERFA|nr:hypothetical protein DERF_011986 [Dermatophagoides farinae]